MQNRLPIHPWRGNRGLAKYEVNFFSYSLYFPFYPFCLVNDFQRWSFFVKNNILRDREYNQSINQSNVDYKKMIYQIRIHVDRYVYAL